MQQINVQENLQYASKLCTRKLTTWLKKKRKKKIDKRNQ